MGSSNLLEALQAVGARLAPAADELGRGVPQRSGEAISEDSPVQCQNPYALSKMAMEMLGDLYFRAFGMKVFKIRAFNFTGPGQDRKFVAADFASQIAAIERGERPAVIRVGNLDAMRDFSDVRDIARFVQVIGARGRGGRGVQRLFGTKPIPSAISWTCCWPGRGCRSASRSTPDKLPAAGQPGHAAATRRWCAGASA